MRLNNDEILHLPVHVDKALVYSIFLWLSILGVHPEALFHCSGSEALMRETMGHFSSKPPHHQVQAGHSGDQHSAKGPIVP